MLNADTRQVYSFHSQLARAVPMENALDRFFSRWYSIEKLPAEIEIAQDIDRLFVRPDGSQVTVEYKVDFMSQDTGNLVVELVSNDTTNTPGWLYATAAEFVAFYRVKAKEVIVARTTMLLLSVNTWEATYRTVSIRNPGYNTIALIIPVWEIKRVAEWVGAL